MLGLLCVGTAIQFKGIQAYFKTAFIISFVRLCIIPIVTFIVLQFFELSYTAVVAIMIFFSIPTASASYILTKLLNGDYQLMAAVISLQTILSVVTLAIMLALVQSYYF